MGEKVKGIGGYLINLFLAFAILLLVVEIRYIIELIYAVFGRKINLKLTP